MEPSKGRPLVLAVFASGRGSNLQAILEAIDRKVLQARVAFVLSDQAEAAALTKAKARGIPGYSVSPKDFASKTAYETHLSQLCQEHQVDLVVLAGFMRLLGVTFIQDFPNRILNMHPALLPAFPGLAAHRQALEYGVRYSGCTVHFVDTGVDTGPILLQAVVPVEPQDTEETLAERILKEEHRLFPEAIQLIAQDRVRIAGRRVWILDEMEPG